MSTNHHQIQRIIENLKNELHDNIETIQGDFTQTTLYNPILILNSYHYVSIFDILIKHCQQHELFRLQEMLENRYFRIGESPNLNFVETIAFIKTLTIIDIETTANTMANSNMWINYIEDIITSKEISFNSTFKDKIYDEWSRVKEDLLLEIGAENKYRLVLTSNFGKCIELRHGIAHPHIRIHKVSEYQYNPRIIYKYYLLTLAIHHIINKAVIEITQNT